MYVQSAKKLALFLNKLDEVDKKLAFLYNFT